MNRALLVLALIVGMACGKKGGAAKPPPSSTPEETFASMHEATRKGDVDALWDLFSDSYRFGLAQMKDDLMRMDQAQLKEELGLTYQELASLDSKAMMKKIMAHPSKRAELADKPTPKVLGVDLEGDKAGVRYQGDRPGEECSQAMVKTAAGWRIDKLAKCKSGG